MATLSNYEKFARILGGMLGVKPSKVSHTLVNNCIKLDLMFMDGLNGLNGPNGSNGSNDEIEDTPTQQWVEETTDVMKTVIAIIVLKDKKYLAM